MNDESASTYLSCFLSKGVDHIVFFYTSLLDYRMQYLITCADSPKKDSGNARSYGYVPKIILCALTVYRWSHTSVT